MGQSLRLAVRCLWIALIQNSSNKAVVAGPGRQVPKAGGERVGRSRERKAKWWRRAIRSTASETLLFQSGGLMASSKDLNLKKKS